jgi:hypothetical protein
MNPILMRMFLSSIFLVAGTIVLAQNGSIKVKKKEDSLTLPKLDTTKQEVNIPGWEKWFFNGFGGIQFIDTRSLSNSVFNGRGNFTAHFITRGGSLILPATYWGSLPKPIYLETLGFTLMETQAISESDSSSWRLNGFRGHLMNFGHDLFKYNRWFDLFIFYGFEYGQMGLQNQLSSGETIKYRNPFFALNLMTDVRFAIYRYTGNGLGISLGVRGGGMLDLTNGKWRYNKSVERPRDLSGTKLTGYYISFVLSILFVAS